MSAPQSRIARALNTAFSHETGTQPAPPLSPQDSVVVNAGETMALMMHAARKNRVWLTDFADETIRVSRDMYEVLLQYKRVAQRENARVD